MKEYCHITLFKDCVEYTDGKEIWKHLYCDEENLDDLLMVLRRAYRRTVLRDMRGNGK